MKIMDMHIHASNTIPSPDTLTAQMQKAGVWGGCVFSNCPSEYSGRRGSSFEDRLAEVITWTRGNKNRLFPVLWIHPHEKAISDKVKLAVEQGVAGFKIICSNFYVYEDACLKLLSEIAALGKPVFFHSGILWDGGVSSKYNRPLNWEALIDIENLRFSMGHCAWPWHDECIALYGQFLNAFVNRKTAEMFFDLTPGTPLIYRRDLLTKLFTVGYDVPDNILFGTDSSAGAYNAEWAGSWLQTDNEIYDSLGIGADIKQKIYHDNLIRFLGIEKKNFSHLSPVPDNANRWSAGYVRAEDGI